MATVNIQRYISASNCVFLRRKLANRSRGPLIVLISFVKFANKPSIREKQINAREQIHTYVCMAVCGGSIFDYSRMKLDKIYV